METPPVHHQHSKLYVSRCLLLLLCVAANFFIINTDGRKLGGIIGGDESMRRLEEYLLPSQTYSPFNLPPYDSPAPPFCVNPPFTPPFVQIPPPSLLSPPTNPPIIIPGPPLYVAPTPPLGPPLYVAPTPPLGPPLYGTPTGPPLYVAPTTPYYYYYAPPTSSSGSFLPPVVYPPPSVPPPPHIAPATALWCVAKPSVPDPIIQEAMNYACASGAECDQILPNGSCFQPDTLFAHASYAFNSYWQRTKVAGGTCQFGGTAMLVTVDPSYDGCQFIYY